MIVKVKEPQAPEVALLEPRHVLFTYLHLAPDAELTQGLMDSGATCIAYETVTDSRGRLPLLAPMSEIAGKIATQAGRVHAREAARRPRPAARRRARRGGGQGDGHRRRRRRPERRRRRDRHGRRDLRLRPLDRPPARAAGDPQRPLLVVLRLDARDRGAPAGDGPRHRRGARPRREGAARDLARAARADEAERGPRRRLDRPGRLLRDLAADDALRPDLRGRRHHALLRRQHAGRGADHVDLGADQRDDAVRHQARRPRRARGARARPRLHGGPQRRRAAR